MLSLLVSAALTTTGASPLPAPAPELRRIPAEEARQGVASDGVYVYAIDNSRIGKYRVADGVRVAQWSGDPTLVPHLNSCAIDGRELVCASSNYPAVPQTSSIEFFDRATLRHLRSRKLGATEGSLTTFERHDGRWWAVFAQYDGKGGAPGKDHRSTRLVQSDRKFREVRQWTLPPGLLDRLKPYSISGASWSTDGTLALSGHDRREIYLMTVPRKGTVLHLEAIVPIGTNGQAIAWDGNNRRALWSISRSDRSLVLSDLSQTIVPAAWLAGTPLE